MVVAEDGGCRGEPPGGGSGGGSGGDRRDMVVMAGGDLEGQVLWVSVVSTILQVVATVFLQCALGMLSLHCLPFPFSRHELLLFCY